MFLKKISMFVIILTLAQFSSKSSEPGEITNDYASGIANVKTFVLMASLIGEIAEQIDGIKAQNPNAIIELPEDGAGVVDSSRGITDRGVVLKISPNGLGSSDNMVPVRLDTPWGEIPLVQSNNLHFDEARSLIDNILQEFELELFNDYEASGDGSRFYRLVGSKNDEPLPLTNTKLHPVSEARRQEVIREWILLSDQFNRELSAPD